MFYCMWPLIFSFKSIFYSVVGKFHPQRVISYLLTKLESNQDKIKGGTQEVFKHLMNSCGMDKFSSLPPSPSSFSSLFHLF